MFERLVKNKACFDWILYAVLETKVFQFFLNLSPRPSASYDVYEVLRNCRLGRCRIYTLYGCEDIDCKMDEVCRTILKICQNQI